MEVEESVRNGRPYLAYLGMVLDWYTLKAARGEVEDDGVRFLCLLLIALLIVFGVGPALVFQSETWDEERLISLVDRFHTCVILCFAFPISCLGHTL